MGEIWMSLAGWCGFGPVSAALGLGLFAMGAAGGVSHCAPMCGSFVLGQVADRMVQVPASHFCEWRRLETAALVPYHLGRLTTYSLIGLVAGMGGRLLGEVPHVSSALLLMAAVLFLVLAARGGSLFLPSYGAGSSKFGHWIARTAPNSRGGRGLATYGLGVCLGFLPCGLVYSALAVSIGIGNPWLSALAMATFGCGTVPALIIVGFAGRAAGIRWRRLVACVAPVAMVANAGLLTALAVGSLVGD